MGKEEDSNAKKDDDNDKLHADETAEAEVVVAVDKSGSNHEEKSKSIRKRGRRSSSEAAVASEEQQPEIVAAQKKSRRSSRCTTAATTTTQAESTSAAAAAAEAPSSSAIAKKKAGRKKSKTAAAATVLFTSSSSITSSKKKNDAKFKQSLLQGALDDARQEFEHDRDLILKQIPQSIQDMFGSIGFVKWSGASKLPVLVMNPYHVPPEPVRAYWFEMFGKVKKTDRLDKMSLLVYWYGEENEKDMYSLISQPSFTPYEEGLAKNPIVSKAIQAKVDTGKPLTKQEKAKIRALQEVQEDLVKDPSERRRGIVNFIEGYQTLKEEDVDEALQEVGQDEEGGRDSDDDDDDDAEEEDGDNDDGIPQEDDDDDEPIKDEKPKKGAAKKKSQKKKGRATTTTKKSTKDSVETEDDMQEADQEDDEPAAPHPKKKAPKKKATARGSKKTNDKVPDEEEMVEDAVVEKAAGKKKKASSKQKKRAADNVEEKEEASAKVAPPKSTTAATAASVNDADIGDADESDDDAKPAAVDDDAVDADGREAAAESKPQSKKTLKGSKKKTGYKKAKLQEPDDSQAVVEEETLEEDVKPTLEEEVEAVMNEASAESEDEDESFDDGGDVGYWDDEGDIEFDFKPASKGQKKTAKSSAGGAKAKKDAPAKKVVKAKHKTKEMLPAQKIRAGKKHFRENEKQFAPLIESWDLACTASDAGKIVKCLATVSKELGNFCAKFIELYSLSNLMKTSKNVLKDQKMQLDNFQDVRHALKTHYLKVQEQYPAFDVKKAPRRVNNDAEVEVKAAEPVASKPKAADTEEPPAGDKSEGQDAKNAAVVKEVIPVKKDAIPVKKEGTLSSMAKMLKSPQKPAAKVEQRPKFTLKNLMRQSTKPPPASVAAPLRSTTAVHVAAKEKPLPAWVSGPTSLKPPPDVARTHARAFLKQMAEHFPHGKIDCDSVAMSVEKAIFEWSTKKVTRGEGSKENLNDKDEEIMNEYWQRVHAIVAGVCGKRDPGPLMHAIMAGDFLNPKNLVELPEGIFFASFEGQELVFD